MSVVITGMLKADSGCAGVCRLFEWLCEGSRLAVSADNFDAVNTPAPFEITVKQFESGSIGT
jgi:hypothetical protein